MHIAAVIVAKLCILNPNPTAGILNPNPTAGILNPNPTAGILNPNPTAGIFRLFRLYCKHNNTQNMAIKTEKTLLLLE